MIAIHNPLVILLIKHIQQMQPHNAAASGGGFFNHILTIIGISNVNGTITSTINNALNLLHEWTRFSINFRFLAPQACVMAGRNDAFTSLENI